MTYVFDSSSFIVLGHYFPARFPSFWERFNKFVANGCIVSVREVHRELEKDVTKPHLREWIEANSKIFLVPSPQETEFVREIFATPQFQTLLKQKQRLTSGPAADAFIIAAAKVKAACVVTEETRRDNAIRIPNVCEHHGVACTSLEGLMEREGWSF